MLNAFKALVTWNVILKPAIKYKFEQLKESELVEKNTTEEAMMFQTIGDVSDLKYRIINSVNKIKHLERSFVELESNWNYHQVLASRVTQFCEFNSLKPSNKLTLNAAQYRLENLEKLGKIFSIIKLSVSCFTL